MLKPSPKIVKRILIPTFAQNFKTMKKHLRLLFLSAIVAFTSSNSNAQCSFTLTASDTSICAGDSTTLVATPPSNTVTTTFAAGNNHRGNMFDIVAINEITITSFDAHPMGNTDFEIYYKVGGFSGSENNAGAWTLVGSAAGVVAQPTGTPTPIPIPVNVTIPAGQTYAFYVTSSNNGVSLNYTDGTAQGSVFTSDANMQFLEGVGLEYPFSGTPFSPRVWNGNIHYYVGNTPTAPSYLWSTGETTSSITVAPSTSTQYNVTVDINGCSLLEDSLVIDVVGAPVNLGPDMDFCDGDSVVLDAGGAGSSYIWSDASTGQTTSVNSSATVYVDVVDTFGCASSDTITLTQHSIPTVNLGADTTICETGSVTLDAGAGFAAYDWSDGTTNQTNIIAGSTLGTGVHTIVVTVTNSGGCEGMDDLVVTVDDCTNINELSTIAFDVYPNPALDNVNIAFNNSISATINLLAMDGKLIQSFSCNGETSKVLDLSNFSAGVYTLNVIAGNQVMTKQLIIK